MIIRLFLGLICSLSLILPASATNWVYITESTRGDILYVDKDSIEYNGDIVSYTSKILLKDPSDRLKKKGTSYIIFNERMNCVNKTKITDHIWFYNSKGEVQIGDDLSEYGFEPFPADSLLDGIHEILCE